MLHESGGGGLRPSTLGDLLLADDRLDPYLEEPATLWGLHFRLTSNRARATTWFCTFSHFHEPEFKVALTAALRRRWSPRSRAHS